jgi:hypothetical protein
MMGFRRRLGARALRATSEWLNFIRSELFIIAAGKDDTVGELRNVRQTSVCRLSDDS